MARPTDDGMDIDAGSISRRRSRDVRPNKGLLGERKRQKQEVAAKYGARVDSGELSLKEAFRLAALENEDVTWDNVRDAQQHRKGRGPDGYKITSDTRLLRRARAVVAGEVGVLAENILAAGGIVDTEMHDLSITLTVADALILKACTKDTTSLIRILQSLDLAEAQRNPMNVRDAVTRRVKSLTSNAGNRAFERLTKENQAALLRLPLRSRSWPTKIGKFDPNSSIEPPFAPGEHSEDVLQPWPVEILGWNTWLADRKRRWKSKRLLPVIVKKWGLAPELAQELQDMVTAILEAGTSLTHVPSDPAQSSPPRKRKRTQKLPDRPGPSSKRNGGDLNGGEADLATAEPEPHAFPIGTEVKVCRGPEGRADYAGSFVGRVSALNPDGSYNVVDYSAARQGKGLRVEARCVERNQALEGKRNRVPSSKAGVASSRARVAKGKGDTGCMICGLSSNPHLVLLCDGCDNEAHLACVRLEKVPEGDWFCGACRRRQQNAGQPSRQKAARTARTPRRPPQITQPAFNTHANDTRHEPGDLDEVDGIVIEASAEPSSSRPKKQRKLLRQYRGTTQPSPGPEARPLRHQLLFSSSGR